MQRSYSYWCLSYTHVEAEADWTVETAAIWRKGIGSKSGDDAVAIDSLLAFEDYFHLQLEKIKGEQSILEEISKLEIKWDSARI